MRLVRPVNGVCWDSVKELPYDNWVCTYTKMVAILVLKIAEGASGVQYLRMISSPRFVATIQVVCLQSTAVFNCRS
jgi:hypothetical protein